MLKKLFNLLKKIVVSAFALYGFNLLVSPLNLIIPINVITVGSLSLLGLPAIFCFIIIYFVAF
ncbi:MAG: pro-sigmaK processing inhibitor BofA family protein [Acholeplasma sp.]|jgi:hypothetical protein|nr:pro-sigmaK processing inhibitor BofA family protein [Acholeplasma sp.]CCY27709.1 unknown [Acholeplasma sp. CAG:878]